MSHEHICSTYDALVELLGKPTRRDHQQASWEGGDKKIRAYWNLYVDGVGQVEIYDYKACVPVEQVTCWSCKAEPAVYKEITRRLVDIVYACPEQPSTIDVFGVERWYYVNDISTKDWPSKLVESAEVIGLPETSSREVRVGLVKHWIAQRYTQQDGVTIVNFYNHETWDYVATIKIERI
jgi:hypothetical protein